MKLYHCRDSRSLRALWALEEMRLDYELEVLTFPPRYQHKEYFAINPLGTVPCLVDGDVRLTESVAICQYLVERYQRYEFGVLPEHPHYGNYLNWLCQSDATLTFPLSLILRYRTMEPVERRQPQVVDDYKAFFLGRLKMLSSHLLTHTYLCDERFTVADICIGFALYFGSTHFIGVGDDYQPQIRDYLARLMERPAFQRTVAIGPVYGAPQ